MARWDTIAQDVLENLSEEGQRKTSKDRVLNELGRVEDDIAREALALEGGATLTTIIAQADYPVAAIGYRIVEVFQPSAWRRPIEVVHNPEIWKRIVSQPHLSSLQPLYITLWNGDISFHPAPVDVQTLTIWIYMRPTALPARGADPTLESQWDDCLAYGATYRLLKKRLAKEPTLQKSLDRYERSYNDELTKVGQQEMKRMVLGPHKVDHSSERLGF